MKRFILAPAPIRVVFAEDSYLIPEAVRRLLETQDEIKLVGVCEDVDSLLDAVDKAGPPGRARLSGRARSYFLLFADTHFPNASLPLPYVLAKVVAFALCSALQTLAALIVVCCCCELAA